VRTLTFSDEIPIPAGMPDFMSPFVATAFNYDFDTYRADEGLRQALVRREFQYLERCRVHFERGNWELFDKESPPTAEAAAPTVKSRLIDLYNAYTAAFAKFTLTSSGKRDRIHQRFRYAKSCSPTLVNDLATRYLGSGRIVSLWREVFSVRQSFVNQYDSLQPLVQVHYWKKGTDCHAIKLSDKKFPELRQLYIDAFETLCRLLVLAMGFEAIIHHRQLTIPTRRSALSLEQFEQLPNAAKRDHVAKYPIEDLFLPVMDTEFRNGLGHHAAHYERELDSILIYDTKDAGTVSRIVGYTEFCEKLLSLFAAFELAAMYHHRVHIYLDGRFV
jgi:hypothetical protein